MAILMVIDALSFARSSGSLGGSLAVAALSRLVQDLPAEQPGDVEWHLRGGFRAGRGWLDVRARGPVRVICQRCLQPFDLALDVSRTLGLVATETQLDAVDALEAAGGGDGLEYVVADPQLSVHDLIEDELILALPFAPRHESCPPGAGGADALAHDGSAASPFAALAAIRKH